VIKKGATTRLTAGNMVLVVLSSRRVAIEDLELGRWSVTAGCHESLSVSSSGDFFSPSSFAVNGGARFRFRAAISSCNQFPVTC
jgi:hypothetical protein